VHQIPVECGTSDAVHALDAAIGALARGECVAVFPEGTISLDLDPMPGKSGTARLARATGAPVFPVGLWGTHRILFKGRKPHWRVGVPQVAVVRPALHIGAHEHVREATDRIMAEICASVRRARELYPERPRAGDDPWWWRDPGTARLRPARGSSDAPREEAAEGAG
jgi:1-acyl-sn-glycerol-3-phosphate acyltransferase